MFKNKQNNGCALRKKIMPRKVGLEYFPVDVDLFQDEKMQFVSARFGTLGEAVVLRLLCKIYRAGYYAEWNDDVTLLFAKSIGDGVTVDAVNKVVAELVKRDFFDSKIFSDYGVLTSRGIQQRYFEATQRRQVVYYKAHLMLIDANKYKNTEAADVDDNITEANDDINADNADIAKYSIEEHRIEKHIRSSALLAQQEINSIMALPLKDDAPYYIHEQDIEHWKEIFSCLDVFQEFQHMKGWLYANLEKRRAGDEMPRFIFGWLFREKEKWAKRQQRAKENPALDYMQHHYDPGELESLYDEL